MSLTMSALSTEYVSVAVRAVKSGALYDPTTDVVSFSLPLTGVAPSVWYAGTWETVGGGHIAKILFGPTGGSVTGSAGQVFDVWIKVTDSPEIPVAKVTTLTLT